MTEEEKYTLKHFLIKKSLNYYINIPKKMELSVSLLYFLKMNWMITDQ